MLDWNGGRQPGSYVFGCLDSGHDHFQLVSTSLFELYHQPPALGQLSVHRHQLWHLRTLAGKPPRKDELRNIDLQSMLALSGLDLRHSQQVVHAQNERLLGHQKYVYQPQYFKLVKFGLFLDRLNEFDRFERYWL